MSINTSLKWIFIAFNALFAVIGIVIAVRQRIELVNQGEGDRVTTGLTYLVGALVAAISILGVYGAYKEKKWALIVFSVLVGLGMVVCLVVSVKTVILRAWYWHCEADKETCEKFNVILDAGVGICFGLALVALIGITMAVSMVCQIKDGEQGPGVMAVPTFDYSKPPPAYSDIYK